MNRTVSQLVYHSPPLIRPLPAIPRILANVEPGRKQPSYSHANINPHPLSSPTSSSLWSRIPLSFDPNANEGYHSTSLYHESVSPIVQARLCRRGSIRNGSPIVRGVRPLPSTPIPPTGPRNRKVRPLPSPPNHAPALSQSQSHALREPSPPIVRSALSIRNDSFPPISPLQSPTGPDTDLPLPYYVEESSLDDEPAFIEWDALEVALGCDMVVLDDLAMSEQY